MKLIYTLFLFASLQSNAATTIEIAQVGLPTKVQRYCLEIKSETGATSEEKCRTLVMTDGSQNGFAPYYERFEKWTLNEENKLALSVDAVTYYKGSLAPFDSKVEIGSLHNIDLNYAENTNVQHVLDSNGLPTISNINLGRYETDEEVGYAVLTIDYEPKTISVTGEYRIFKKDKDGVLSAVAEQVFPINETYSSVD